MDLCLYWHACPNLEERKVIDFSEKEKEKWERANGQMDSHEWVSSHTQDRGSFKRNQVNVLVIDLIRFVLPRYVSYLSTKTGAAYYCTPFKRMELLSRGPCSEPATDARVMMNENMIWTTQSSEGSDVLTPRPPSFGVFRRVVSVSVVINIRKMKVRAAVEQAGN
jgi:hypothetical protein